jgi:spermidine synthase
MIVHVPLMAHGSAREVLVIGGGDGGCLREALKHEGVARVTQVEIDRGVIDMCVKYLPTISDGAFDSARARVVIADGARFAAETADRFDVVIVDSTDPQGPGAALFTPDFYRDCRRLLRAAGSWRPSAATPRSGRTSWSTPSATSARPASPWSTTTCPWSRPTSAAPWR